MLLLDKPKQRTQGVPAIIRLVAVNPPSQHYGRLASIDNCAVYQLRPFFKTAPGVRRLTFGNNPRTKDRKRSSK
jgi:hypothetical protein